MKKTFLVILCSFVFLCGCSANSADNDNKITEYEDEINDLKNELLLLNEKVNNLNLEKEKSESKIEELIDLIQLVTEQLNNKENELEEINNKLYEILYKDQKIKEYNELVYNILSYDLTYYNVVNKMQNDGVTLDEYLLYKENDKKIKDNKSLEEKLDYFYYHYNDNGSIEYLKHVASASKLSWSLDLSSGYNDTIILKSEDDVVTFNIYENSYYLNNKMNDLKKTYLSYWENSYLSYNNIAVDNKLSFLNMFVKDNLFPEVKKYLDNINTDVTTDNFIFKLNEIKENNNYDYEIEYFKNESIDNYYIGLGGELIAGVYYVYDENNLEYFDKYFKGNIMGSSEYKKKEYKYIYFYGNVAIYLLPENRNENIELIKDTQLYKLILSWDNGLDIKN